MKDNLVGSFIFSLANNWLNDPREVLPLLGWGLAKLIPLIPGAITPEPAATTGV